MDTRYEQLENENWFTYAERLINGRKDGIYDLDKVEIYEYLTGEVVSADHARKNLCFMEKMIEKYKNDNENNIIDNDEIKKNELKLIELKKERYKLQTLRHDLNKTVRETSRSELKIEEFMQELKNMHTLELPEFKVLKPQNIDREYVLGFADVHFGKEFISMTNEYSIDETHNRFNKLMCEVVDIIEEKNINKLHILGLGDLVEGACLRINQLNKLKIGITQQTIQFMRFLVKWLSDLSEFVEIVYYATTYSNHSQIRPFGTKANQFEDEDVEKIIFAYIQDMLKNNDRINIIESEGKDIIFKLFDFNIIANHGHKIKNINKYLGDISSKYKIFFDYGFFAHTHHSDIKTIGEGQSGNNNCEIIKVPSIMGTDEYADDLLVGAKAGAVLIEFTESQGKRVTYDIILN